VGRGVVAESPVETPRLRDRLAVAAFVFGALLPVLVRSTVHTAPLPGTPELLDKVHALACLFTKKPEGWSSYYVQIRYPDRMAWETVEQAELFPLQPFGRRTRMHRLMVAWQAKPSPKTQDLARWIVVRQVERHPERPPPDAIRFTRAWMIPSRDEPPQHGWQHPKWDETSPRTRRVIVEYAIADLLADDLAVAE
jgi:hypothetical protein